MRAISSNGFTEDEVLEAYYGEDLLYAFRFGLYTYDLAFIRYLDGVEEAKSVNDADAKINGIFSCTIDGAAAGQVDFLNQVIGPEVWMRMPRAGADGDPYAKFLVDLYEPKTHPLKIDSTRKFYNLQGYDLTQRLADSELDEPYVIEVGTPYFDAVSGILTAGGFVRQNISVPDLTLPEARTWAIGEGVTLLKVLDDLLEGINCVRHPEPNGSYTVRAWLNPESAGAGFIYTADERSVIYREASIEQDSYEGYNEVFMTSTAPEREGTPWTARATNDDMTSPLYGGNRGNRTYRKVLTNVEAASQEMLREKCNRRELEYRHRYITASLSTRIAPWHGTREIVGIDNPAMFDVPRRFEEKRWEIIFKADSQMSHSFTNKPRAMVDILGGSNGTVPKAPAQTPVATKLARINPAWDGGSPPTIIFAEDLNSGVVSGPFAYNPDIPELMPGDWVKVERLGNTWYIASRVRAA